MFKLMWREITEGDICCSIPSNLVQTSDFEGKAIDGCFVCSVCNKTWIESETDDFTRGKLQTTTEFGDKFFKGNK